MLIGMQQLQSLDPRRQGVSTVSYISRISSFSTRAFSFYVRGEVARGGRLATWAPRWPGEGLGSGRPCSKSVLLLVAAFSSDQAGNTSGLFFFFRGLAEWAVSSS